MSAYIVTFDCPHCKTKVLTSGEWFDAHDDMPCPFCRQRVNLLEVDTDDEAADFPVEGASGGKDPRKDFEALFQGQTDPTNPNRKYFYVNPALECEECGATIWLPYRSLPETDMEGTPLQDNDLLELPPDEWTQVFGCIRCGHIATYAGYEVEMLPVRMGSRSPFHVYADVWLVIFRCGNKDCPALLSVHLDMRKYHATPNTADANDAVAALRSVDFAGQPLRCGHDLRTVPATFYHATRVTGQMW